MLPAGEPVSPSNCIFLPQFMPLNQGCTMPVEDVLRLQDVLIIDDRLSPEEVTVIACEKLGRVQFDATKFLPEEVRVWFLAYQFAFAKMKSLNLSDLSESDKRSHIQFVSAHIHLIATRYFTMMQENFSGKPGHLDALFDFRRTQVGFDLWVAEESVTGDIYSEIDGIRQDEEEFAQKRRVSKEVRRFTFDVPKDGSE